MEKPNRTVLISGCSDGGIGAELAKELHNAGLKVYATARKTASMAELEALGIETLQLDIQSEESIQDCVRLIPRLDILINNAGMQYTMPVSDISLKDAKAVFDTNVWGHIALTQHCLPLLQESVSPMIVNHTSVGSTMSMPFMSVYNASKAALSMFSDCMRLELAPFGIKVINLKTGAVKTNIITKLAAKEAEVPGNSIYFPAKEALSGTLRGDGMKDGGMPADQWAKQVAKDLLKANPSSNVWRGQGATMVWILGLFPYGTFDFMLKKISGLSDVVKELSKQGKLGSK
ncbi:related to short-chain dehydrogenase/reductase [Ramularia collo-cygni]|uniref:Related to short-chain dehydrogenase/reductase n=1 Tax=Ramularia collo-cygni TaxID=112498 RepID=A0A2D3US92_9PEZI|nr:related to short-chain dehydrogenase/reductase [Ramularia collo-cygni]CZT15480.1 related to short-chain dehydrogenase/reductase [Ramularia collo-cygni]